MTNTTFSINQNTNQEMNFAARKPVEFTPIPMSYANLLPYLLDNAMIAITTARFPQTSIFLRIRLERNVCLSWRSPRAFH